MTTADSIHLHKSNLQTKFIINTHISGSNLLISSIASLNITEAPIKPYKMLQCSTII
jgi:hypothetical protein